MEPRFGHDFGDVRVHTDSEGAESARAVNALAYTVGRHVVFGTGQYAPATRGGERLLAHELTHTLQQQTTSGALSDLTVAPSDSSQETEAEKFSETILHPRPIRPTLARFSLQRQPQTLRDQICYRPGQVPPHEPGDCDSREPENCPTYELWVNTFSRLSTFESRDTAPGGTQPTSNEVFGQSDQPATRPVDVAPNTPIPSEQQPSPAIRPQVADRFIDHPTDQWVQTCLPDNLRETAYRLPTDCADIAVILRHVWLSAQHRTETYGAWVVGDRAGGARRESIATIIGEVYSGSVSGALNPYSNSSGQPLRTFAELQHLLHPGDVLVWEHHAGGPGTARTGGDTETIIRIDRDNGVLTGIEVVQGNEPLRPAQAHEIQRAIGGGAPSEQTLRAAPGRRIELHSLQAEDLRDRPLPPRHGQAASAVRTFWTLSDLHTTLVAAGPPRSAQRPAMRTIQGQRIRRLSDWFSAVRRAAASPLIGIVEAALLELRAMIEGGQTGLDADATTLGQTAGERLWNLARRANDLGDESHFRPLRQVRAMIQALGNPAGQPGYASSATRGAKDVERIFNLVDEAFHLAARGATTISFTRSVAPGTTVVRQLVTGFDPFVGTAAVPPGVINPSGAAALALDGTVVSVSQGVTAAVEGVVLPVDFGDFRRGMVENIVRPLVQSRQVDAVITVSLDETIVPTGPVRIERFVVGVHSENGQLGAVPATSLGGLGPAIIESPAPVADIARDTGQQAGIPQPTIGTDVTFRFPTAAMADSALIALGLAATGNEEVSVSDVSALQQIIRTMQRAANGTDITFQAGGRTFQTTVLSGPGGDFLSNEVSFRVLRLLREQGRLDLPSFHVHVPRATPQIGDRIPQDTSTPAARTARQQAIAFARGVRDRLIATLRSMIRAVATRVAPLLNPPRGRTP